MIPTLVKGIKLRDIYLIQEIEPVDIKPLELENFNEEENKNIILSETD